MSKRYTGANTLLALMQLVKSGLKAKIDVANIANDLETSDEGKVLGASQAKAILTEVDNKITTSSSSTSKELSDLRESLETMGHNAMVKSNYDSDEDGVVDKAKVSENAEKLGGISASKYVVKTDDGKIDSSLLPSYVDDVIDGYYHDGYFYKNDNTLESEWPEDDKIPGEPDKIYIDVLTSVSYRWSGTTFAQITSSDMVEITAEEVEAAWTSELMP